MVADSSRPTNCSISRRIDIAITELSPISANGRSVCDIALGQPQLGRQDAAQPVLQFGQQLIRGHRRPVARRRRRAVGSEVTAAASSADCIGAITTWSMSTRVTKSQAANASEASDRARPDPFQLGDHDLRLGAETEAVPGHPVQADGVAALPVAGAGQAVEVGVGRGVGALPGDAEDGARRRGQVEEVEAARGEDLVQRPRARDLRPQGAVHALLVDLGEQLRSRSRPRRG